MPSDLNKAQKALGYKFKDQKLLLKALTHKSYAAETGTDQFNERMEFLGDSILSAVAADFLFNKYPDNDEGRLSQIKSQIVSSQHLARWAKKIKLGDFLYISNGEELNGARSRINLLADTFEAVIAAIYIDSGFEAAGKFISGFLSLQRRVIITDSKSKLQELVQSKYQTLPEYKVLNESGPDHDKTFEIGVYLKKKQLGAGIGRCKKDAEQAAAKKALKTIAAK